MPRTARAALGGLVYHVLNRGNGRMGIFRKPGDYQAFLQLLLDGRESWKGDIHLFKKGGRNSDRNHPLPTAPSVKI